MTTFLNCSMYSIYKDKDVIPYLGFDPMSRADFVKVKMDSSWPNSCLRLWAKAVPRDLFKPTHLRGFEFVSRRVSAFSS